MRLRKDNIYCLNSIERAGHALSIRGNNIREKEREKESDQHSALMREKLQRRKDNTIDAAARSAFFPVASGRKFVAGKKQSSSIVVPRLVRKKYI